MTKPESRQVPRSNSKKHSSTRKHRARPRRNVRFEATVNGNHVHLHASAPTKWFRVLVRILVIILIALLILKMPEVWQAIQMAIQAMPK